MADKKKNTNGLSFDKLPTTSGYTEPTDYIPKSIRKQTGVGEYSSKTPKKK